MAQKKKNKNGKKTPVRKKTNGMRILMLILALIMALGLLLPLFL